MAQDDPVKQALDSAKSTLAKATRFTESTTGNSTNAFAPKEPPKLHVPQAHASHPMNASYGLASDARETGAALDAKKANVQQYVDSTKK
jgi:hypothetical protein